MSEFLNKLFNIRPSEWPRVVVLFSIIMLTDAAAILGATIAYAAFLQQGGIESLPWVLGVNSLLSIFAIAIYTAFVDRIANDTLMMALYAISAVGIVFGLGLLWLNFSPLIAYSLLYLVDLALTPAFGTHVTTYVNGFYDIQAAKRVLPVIFAGSRAGIILGGLTLSFLTDWLTPESIISIWFLTYIGIIMLMRSIPQLLKQEKSQSHHTEKPSPPPTNHPVKKFSTCIDNLKEGLRYIVQSSYLRWMTIGTFLVVVLMTLVEYKSSEILLGIYGTSEGLASFLAVLIGVSNIIGLPILMFVISRVITSWGVGNVSLLYPICNLFICGGLIVSPGLISASTAYLGRSTLRSVLHFPVDGLLYNAVPLHVKGRARAFVTGLIVPIGILLGSVLLLTPGVSTTWWIMPGLIGVLALAYVVTTMIIRQQYCLALIKMLEQEDYSFLLSQEASNLTVTDPAALRQLQKKLQESTNTEFTLFMAQLISQVGGPKAISMLTQEARASEDARIRAAIIDILVAADFRDDTLVRLYTDFLTDPAGSVRQSAISGLSRLADLKDEQFLSLMLGMIHDPDFNVQNQALLLLASSDTFYQLSSAVEVLEQFLKSPEPSQRVYGVRILGQIGDEQSIRRVFDFLDDSSDEVRLRAAITLEKLSSRTGFVSFIPMLVENMERLLRDPVERVRQAALTLYGKIDVHVSNQPLIFALRDPSPRIRATAADALVQIGKSIIPVIHPHLNSGDPQVRKMTAVILSRVHPGEFKTLVTGTAIMENLLTIYRNCGLVAALHPCGHYMGMTILHCTLHEQNQHMLEEIFYLLEAIQDPSSIKLIQESLKNEDPHIRANAIEALESFSTPQIAMLIAPLFHRDILSTQVLSLSKETWDMEPPDMAQAFRQLLMNVEDSWLRTITAFALAQMAFASDQPDSEERLNFEEMLDIVNNDPDEDVRLAPQIARRMISDFQVIDRTQKENIMLSTIEKVIFLKQVSFFEEMTIEQLKVLANVCEEKFFEADSWLFHQGESGGTLYVVINGRVGIEQEKRKGSSVRVNTLDAYAYFGEVTVFDASVHTAGAIAIQDTIILRLGREPLLALARQYPELSLKLIYALNKQLRQAYDRIGELSRSRPRELHKLFDQFD